MNKAEWKTNHIVYRIDIESKGRGLFYIGAHTCTTRSNSCSRTVCNYKGSSRSIRDLRRADPGLAWSISVIAHAWSRAQLRQLEEVYISSFIHRKGCLNIKASGQCMPSHTEEGIDQMRCASRSKGTHMYPPGSDGAEWIERSQIEGKCIEGYAFSSDTVNLKNDITREVILVSSKTAASVLPELVNCGWVYGSDRRYERIGAKELWRRHTDRQNHILFSTKGEGAT